MSFCRNHLLQANFLKRLPTTNVLYPSLATRPQTVLHIRFASKFPRTLTPRRQDARVGGRFLEGSVGRDALVPASAQELLDPAKRQAEEAKYGIDSMKKRAAPVWTYFRLRKFAPHLIVNEGTFFLHKVMSAGRKDRVLDVFHCLAKDLPAHYQGTKPLDRLEILSRLLTAVSAEMLISKERLLLLVQSLHDSDELHLMARRAIGFAARYVAQSEPDATLDPPLIALLTPHLLDHALHPDPDDDSRINRVEGAYQVSPLFYFVQRLSFFGQAEEALAIFQDLIKHGFLTDEDMQVVDLSSQDFKSIIISSIVHSCIQRGWLARAMDFLSGTLKADKALHESFGGPIRSLAQMLLDRQKRADLDAIARMLVKLAQLRDASVLPSDMLMEFYDSARKTDRGDLMEIVYQTTRKEQVHTDQPFPYPTGPNILFLLRYCASQSKNHGVAHLLTQHIVDEDIPIPMHDVGSIIATTASLGFAKFSRELWERYRTRSDSELLLGNAGTMVRLVSLFGAVAHRWEQYGTQGPFRSPGFRPLHLFPEEGSVDESSTSVHLPDIEAETTSEPQSDSPEPPVPRYQPILDVDGEGEVDADTIDRETRAKDARAFANNVIDAFKARKAPLKDAPHHDLNALARAYFIMDQIPKGFVALKYLLDRKEVPDLHDVNVALSAMAEYDPKGAFRMINRMVKLGLQPNAVTFGTVIHRAIVHEDMDLVAKLIVKARELHLTELTFKTLGTLIRSSIPSQWEPQDSGTAREGLEKAQELVGSLLDADFVPSPRMGVDCIIAALRADDPVMAFKFWNLIVKDKDRWDGKQQVRTRDRIARCIRKHCLRGSLDRDLGRTMLSALGENESVATEERQTSAPPTPPPPRP